MNATQIHLALMYVPVLLSIAGVVMLIIGMVQKNATFLKTALFTLLIGGLFTIPVYLTGEGTEEVVEHLPGVSEPVMEQHEEMGKNAFSIAVLEALLCAIGLLFFNKTSFSRLFRPIILVVALASAGVMTYTAHLGRQVRHAEMHSTDAPADESGRNIKPNSETEEEE